MLSSRNLAPYPRHCITDPTRSHQIHLLYREVALHISPRNEAATRCALAAAAAELTSSSCLEGGSRTDSVYSLCDVLQA